MNLGKMQSTGMTERFFLKITKFGVNCTLFIFALCLSSSLRNTFLPVRITESEALITYNWGSTVDNSILLISICLSWLVAKDFNLNYKWLVVILLIGISFLINLRTLERLLTHLIWSVGGFV
jgi:hypothetical protein